MSECFNLRSVPRGMSEGFFFSLSWITALVFCKETDPVHLSNVIQRSEPLEKCHALCEKDKGELL